MGDGGRHLPLSGVLLTKDDVEDEKRVCKFFDKEFEGEENPPPRLSSSGKEGGG